MDDRDHILSKEAVCVKGGMCGVVWRSAGACVRAAAVRVCLGLARALTSADTEAKAHQ